jgi:hydroxymethylpyrimidine pyrophosphatase-like HAD family hydrolase
MRFKALATDYDGTIARDGLVADSTVSALARLKQSGRRLIMVTGRELPELLQLFSDVRLFDLVVAENGAIMFDPASNEEIVLAPTPSAVLVEHLRAAGVPDISVGRSIIALWKPHEVTVLETIRDLGLELHIVFNKEAVMVLPSTVNKLSGLAKALDRLGLDAANVVGIGDAENDQDFLKACGFSVAVDNAIPSLKERVMMVTAGARGEGAVELIDEILADDLAERLARHGDAVTR